MAQWGRRDGVALTGNVSIASANTTLSGLTGAIFTTELKRGVWVTADGQQFQIVSVTNANTAVVTPAAGSAISNKAAVLNDKPLYLTRDEALNTTNISVAEAKDANNRVIGVKSPGWVQASTYTAGPGGSITRRKVEVMVAMKVPN